jgi:uncharacterized RDD family membrane protein YckC
MSSGSTAVRCLRCGAYTQGTQVCADCLERQRIEEKARAERVSESIAQRASPVSGSSTSGFQCPSCGMFASSDAKFCGYCRHSFQGVPDVYEANTATLRRIFAWLIDSVLLVVVLTALILPLADFVRASNGEVVRVQLPNGIIWLALGVPLGYYIVFELFFGATIGKLLLGLRVIKVSGEPYDIGAVLVRNFLRIIDAIPFGLYIVGLICIAMTEKKQRLGDIVAGTAVVKASTAKARPGRTLSPFA